MRVSLVLPPITQLNTPYPSTGFLSRALREAGHSVAQRDLGIELATTLFSRAGLTQLFDRLEQISETKPIPEFAWRSWTLRRQHIQVVDSVVRFLQGRDPTVARRIATGSWLPVGPRLESANPSQLGPHAVLETARLFATLYLEDLADLVTACIDPGFGFARYHHQLALSQQSFDPIAARLEETTLLDTWLDDLTDSILTTDPSPPDLVGISVPFPGTLLAGLRIGKRLKQHGIPVVMGGGYVNTELRSMKEPRLWDAVDALIFDDGEGPLLAILEQMETGTDHRHRTRTRPGLETESGWHQQECARPPFNPAPDYDGLDLSRYLQVQDSTNPAHRLWSDGLWNKFMMAHGCYWRRCTFCDTSLDYISRYQPGHATTLVDHVERIVRTTGQTGFHFVDEAAPPRVMRDFALELMAREVQISWWGNIRFEKAFTPDLARLLAASGLIAVSGGMEVLSDRLLRLMQKGVSISQLVDACVAFQNAGVLVHAYLMYGFPSQTRDEFLEAMETARQFFVHGLIDSGFWHRFVLTRHSPIFRDPNTYGLKLKDDVRGSFANNDVDHTDDVGVNPDSYDEPLAQSIAHWMEGQELERSVGDWFDPPRPLPTLPAPFATPHLELHQMQPDERLIWIGGKVLETKTTLVLHGTDSETIVTGSATDRNWLAEIIDTCSPDMPPTTWKEIRASYSGNWQELQPLWEQVRLAGLLAV